MSVHVGTTTVTTLLTDFEIDLLLCCLQKISSCQHNSGNISLTSDCHISAGTIATVVCSRQLHLPCFTTHFAGLTHTNTSLCHLAKHRTVIAKKCVYHQLSSQWQVASQIMLRYMKQLRQHVCISKLVGHLYAVSNHSS